MHEQDFPICRGVLEGDLISLLYFIIALEYVFRTCDTGSTSSVIGLTVNNLFYADDSGLLNWNTKDATERLAALAKGLLEMADMTIHPDKTKVMHAQETVKVEKSKHAKGAYEEKEVKKLLTEKCEACGRTSPTLHGLHVHQGRWCDLSKRLGKQDYEVEAVLESRGPIDDRFYFVSWKGCGQEKNCWVPDRWCECHDLIERFFFFKSV